MRTYTAKPGDVQRAWHVIDAEGLVLGRMCTTVATLLRGKHKPMFTPSMDTGDHVIIINASKVVLTSGKADDKIVMHHIPVYADSSISFFDFSRSAEMIQQGYAAAQTYLVAPAPMAPMMSAGTPSADLPGATRYVPPYMTAI